MALDKLVDSTQLDSGLTSVANAIRAKSGGSSQLAFPAGFVSAIDAIPTGITPSGTKQISITANGTTTEDVTNYASAEITVNVSGGSGDAITKLIDGTLTSLTDNDATTVRARAFEQLRALTSVSLPNVVSVNENSFHMASGLVNVNMKKLKTINGSFVFTECTSLTVIALPALTSIYGAYTFRFDSKLEAVDLGAPDNLQQQTFAGCTKLKKIILRRENGICALGGTNSFTSTPFASGGSGGTIYIPKALYDHLGDASALDYKAATNWSTIDGYGTITWAKIEGSIYETAYADGTPIT